MGARSRAISTLNYDESMIIYDEEVKFRWQSYFSKETYGKIIKLLVNLWSKSIISSQIFCFILKKMSHLSMLGISARLE